MTAHAAASELLDARTDVFASGTFTWIAGIEDTCVYPPARFDMAPLDEHELTGHNGAWRSDLAAVRELGATALRYGVDWPRVHLARHEYDWSSLDERLQYAASLGLTVIADLVHYGTPTWLDGSFADPAYPSAIAEFGGAFAKRYAGIVNHITPLNEPITTASFAGLRGVWPPALTGWDGWTRVVIGIADGIQQTIAAVRSANPAASIVHVEASSLHSPDHESLEDEARLLNRLGTIPTDLVLGMVSPGQESYGWLVEHGAAPETLASLARAAVSIDILGINYYPDLSPRLLVASQSGHTQQAFDRWTEGLRATLHTFSDRYRLPMLITETSIEGSDELRAAWVRDSVETVRALAVEGLDIRGWTWWPVFDFVDWSYASNGRNVEEFVLPPEIVAARTSSTSKEPYLRRMGLIRLEELANGALRRIPTAAATEYSKLAHGSLDGPDAAPG
ncbi:MAG TPA: family 1 glycosylhydrolase [Microbacteriaceae bacterium]|jgi:beta-glucosidase/6-phospho-beta-glucosidase/beta-galactosidase|nr:family 1 glycosylhydrolase [Microbacteriaceae bacterium]